MSVARLTAATSAFLLLTVPLTACSDSDAGDAGPAHNAQATATSAASATAPNALTPTNGGPTGSEVSNGEDDDAGAGTGAGTGSDGAGAAGSGGGDGSGGEAANAEEFLVGNGYFFLSPDGGAYCAILGTTARAATRRDVRARSHPLLSCPTARAAARPTRRSGSGPAETAD